jgi:hypothetical protein
MKIQILTVFYLIQFSSSKILVFPEEKIEKCPEFIHEGEGLFNFDELEIITESDTEIFINGSMTFMKDFKAPWKSEFYAEQLVRNSWIQTAIRRKYDDFCTVIHSPVEVWYTKFRDVQGCNYKKGVKTS